MLSSVNNENLPRMPLQPRCEFLFTHLQFRTDLVKAMHAVQVFGKSLLVDEVLDLAIITLLKRVVGMISVMEAAPV